MTYDKPFMLRLSAQEHALLDDQIRREDTIVSKAEMIRRLIHRAGKRSHADAFRDVAVACCRHCAEGGPPKQQDNDGVWWHANGSECGVSTLMRTLEQIVEET